LPDGDDVKVEREMLEMEVRNSLDTLLQMGDGDLALGACYGIETGVLDTMFSPYRKLRGKVKIVRDARGALRYLDHGDIPLPQPVIDYHRSRIAERSKKEGTEPDLSWVIREATWASRPLSEEVKERSY
jgi:methylaspartate mutase epsilon subunit